MTAEQSLEEALTIAAAFSDYYGIDLYWSGALTTEYGTYVYKFTGGITDAVFTDLIGEMQTDIATGFLSVVDPADVVASPVKAVAVGEYMGKGAIRAISYVDPDAIVSSGGEYTLSTNNLFGEEITIFDDPAYETFSVVKFRFPYTINPLSISPETDNFAPQITGKMDWVMQNPWYVRLTSSNFEVVFNINYDELSSAPRVAVNMAYDQDLLNTQGILQMDYNVTNTGTEPAKNITISYPLGRDFMKFYSHLPSIFRLRDDVTVNESEYIPVDISIIITVDGEEYQNYNQTMMVLEGWYVYDNGSLVDIDPTITEATVKTETAVINVAGFTYTVNTEVKLNSSKGLSNILINRATQFLENITISDYNGDWEALFDDYKDELKNGIDHAAKDLFNLLYQNQTIFDFNGMDFEIV
ncbi:MAG: hypothetical protein ACTSSM_16400, partial [Promethearchaeota archaeon]